MRILILNGNPTLTNRAFDDYIMGVVDTLNMMGHKAKTINLAKQNINYCTGCWSCWVKTPGRCIFKDDMEENYFKIIKSDLLLMASPLKMGFISGTLKKTMDRMIPLLTPFFTIVKNEFHHQKRYKKYPHLGLLLENAVDTDNEDIEIIKTLFNRFAINFHSKLKIVHFTNQSTREFSNAINSL